MSPPSLKLRRMKKTEETRFIASKLTAKEAAKQTNRLIHQST